MSLKNWDCEMRRFAYPADLVSDYEERLFAESEKPPTLHPMMDEEEQPILWPPKPDPHSEMLHKAGAFTATGWARTGRFLQKVNHLYQRPFLEVYLSEGPQVKYGKVKQGMVIVRRVQGDGRIQKTKYNQPLSWYRPLDPLDYAKIKPRKNTLSIPFPYEVAIGSAFAVGNVVIQVIDGTSRWELLAGIPSPATESSAEAEAARITDLNERFHAQEGDKLRFVNVGAVYRGGWVARDIAFTYPLHWE